MLTRALILALACACAAALAPLAVGGEDSDCALYLTGPGRSSAYDYSINLLKGNFGYDGQHTCITYEAVNQAYLEARQRILVSQPKGDWKPEDYASVGELVLDISINLARRYGLTYEEIEKGLPLIDTSRTLIREVCPPVFSHVECRAGKYRRLDGLCNNLNHPTWGAINSPFQRLLSPLFSDGINSPRIAHSGHDLPLSRVVSRTMHPDDGFHDHAGTVMVIAWGQFMDHDYTLTGTPLDPINRNDPEECCKRPPHLKHPYCNEIRIPDDDYFYRLFGVKCIDFVRGFPSPRPGCRLGSRIPFNTLTGAIDGNTVYGVTEKFARKLRTGFGGLLRMNPVFKEYGLKDLLPLKLDIPDEGCTRPNKNMYCFEAGEIRVNEQLVLTVMHTLMAREHNRVAHGLAEVNPHWDDETLYQEARRINIAEIQHITYNEFLPILLGKDVMEKFGLVLEKQGFWNGYDSEVNPDVLAAFAAAAYRFGHSLLPTAVERWSKAHKFIASKRLSDLIRRPYDLYRAGVLDEYVMGLMNQVAQAMDDSITQEVTNHLFKKVGARFGMDLVSFNMQRGREFGLPGYMEFRKFCGLPGADSFQDLFGSMTNETVRKYESIFEHPVDVDLWSGGVSERPLPGSMLGPTFACIIATQFSYSRRGDRFWFELPNQPSSFTPEQLTEIRKSRLARVICDNTDIIDTVQLYPMVLPDHELNPRVPCRSGILPSMDFSKWAEPAPFHGTSKGFMTDAYVSRNVSNATESATSQAKEDTNRNNTNEDNCLSDSLTINLKCNETNASKLETQIQSNISSNSSKSDNFTRTIANPHNDQSTLFKEADVNTVFKYVSKKNEVKDVSAKTYGHPKNTLRRRKRSANLENIDGTKAPLIVNYETSHDPQRDVEVWLPARNTANVVKHSALADFNIETLHDNEQQKKNIHGTSTETIPENANDSNENVERENHTNNAKSRINSEESNERNESSENSGENEPYPRNNEKYSDSQENYRKENINDERDRHSSIELENADVKNSKEDGDSKEYDKSKYTTSNRLNESVENSSEETENSNVLPSKNEGPNSDEESTSRYKTQERYQYKPEYDSKTTPQAKIQDVDLGEYERIQVNENGEIEAAKDTHESTAFDPAIDVILTTKPDNGIKQSDKISSLSKHNTDSSSLESHDHNEPTHINDGEVKPVVEINSDVYSTESTDENSNEALKEKLENESLETLTGVNEEDSSEKSDKLQEDNKSHNQSDVKQQFERIPLNYNHADKKQSKDSNVKHVEPKEQINDNGNDEGTIDKLKPRYDENLNIKFDDINIKLPEIKLPDDILSYAYENPPVYKDEERERPTYYQDSSIYNNNKEIQREKPTYHKVSSNYDKNKEEQVEKPKYYRNNNDEEQQPRFYHYSDEVEDEPRARIKQEEDDDEPNDKRNDYYGYYADKKKKQDYTQNQNNDDEKEDDDLYEKFVRERFGKRGTFEKRLEKLTDYKAQNPHLYQKVQKILKKTKDVKSEAEKSGDPNAGYMWTLEYGEKL